MADPEPSEAPKTKKKSKLPLILGVVLALALGAGGFSAVWMGLLFGHEATEEMAEAVTASPLPDIAFVPVSPLVINLGEGASARHLRFQAQIEVNKAYAADVTEILPRIVDVLNSYLRAVEVRELEDRSSLVRLRAQMLRRIQLVAGEGRVRDLLIMEFVLN